MIFFVLIFCLVGIYIAFLGFTAWLGLGWGIFALLASFIFPPAMLIGVYFGATLALGLAWYWALLITFPAIALLIGIFLGELFDQVRKSISK